jgi:hypothetical protein
MTYVEFALLEDEVFFFDGENFGGVVLRLVGDKTVAFGVAARIRNDSSVFDHAKVGKVLAELVLGSCLRYSADKNSVGYSVHAVVLLVLLLVVVIHFCWLCI